MVASPPFDNQEGSDARIAMKTYGGHSMVDPLRRVLVRRPDEAFAVDDPGRWNYAGRPDLEAARREHDALVEILAQAGAEVALHPAPQPQRADSL